MAKKIRPLEDRVVIQQIEAEEKTAGGIVLPDTAKEKPQEGTVLAVGPGRLNDKGERVKPEVKTGDTVLYARYSGTDVKVDMSLFELTLYEKQLRGCVFGSANPHADIPRLLSLYRSGLLKLDELVTRTYGLHEVNEGYQDMFDGLNIRGVIRHTH